MDRLHDVQLTVINNEMEASCGFFKGPADRGDWISVYCASGAVGRYVLMKILSQSGEADYINVCEVQVFVNSKQQKVSSFGKMFVLDFCVYTYTFIL